MLPRGATSTPLWGGNVGNHQRPNLSTNVKPSMRFVLTFQYFYLFNSFPKLCMSFLEVLLTKLHPYSFQKRNTQKSPTQAEHVWSPKPPRQPSCQHQVLPPWYQHGWSPRRRKDAPHGGPPCQVSGWEDLTHKWLMTMVIYIVVVPYKDRDVGPLPNCLFMAYKWRVTNHLLIGMIFQVGHKGEGNFEGERLRPLQ